MFQACADDDEFRLGYSITMYDKDRPLRSIGEKNGMKMLSPAKKTNNTFDIVCFLLLFAGWPAGLLA